MNTNHIQSFTRINTRPHDILVLVKFAITRSIKKEEKEQTAQRIKDGGKKIEKRSLNTIKNKIGSGSKMRHQKEEKKDLHINGLGIENGIKKTKIKSSKKGEKEKRSLKITTNLCTK